jgi:hypothetical protein
MAAFSLVHGASVRGLAAAPPRIQRSSGHPSQDLVRRTLVVAPAGSGCQDSYAGNQITSDAADPRPRRSGRGNRGRARRSATSGDAVRIVIADDEALLREGLARLFWDAGFERPAMRRRAAASGCGGRRRCQSGRAGQRHRQRADAGYGLIPRRPGGLSQEPPAPPTAKGAGLNEPNTRPVLRRLDPTPPGTPRRV